MSKGTIENLVSLADRPKEERQEIARRGAYARADKERKKKEMREWAELIGALPIEVVCPDGKKLEGGDLNGAAVMAQYRKAVQGDTRAARLILDLRGDLVQRVEHTGNIQPIIVNTEEEKKDIESIGDLDI